MILLGVVAIVVLSTSLHGRTHSRAPGGVSSRRLPPYWIVRPGDTMAQISYKTGLSVGQLEAYNPNANPQALTVGEPLLLWPHPPAPRLAPATPLGPVFWTVRVGQSYGSIAAATGINMAKLEQLNPQVPPNNVQPGDQIMLWAATVGQQAAMNARLREGDSGTQR